MARGLAFRDRYEPLATLAQKGGWEKKEKWVRIGWGCGRNGDEFWVFSVLAFISRRIFDMSKRTSRAEQSIRAHAPNRRTTHCTAHKKSNKRNKAARQLSFSPSIHAIWFKCWDRSITFIQGNPSLYY